MTYTHNVLHNNNMPQQNFKDGHDYNILRNSQGVHRSVNL